MAQKPQGMHPEDIKAALRKRFGSMAAFSVLIGRDERAVSKTISASGYSAPVEKEIAKVLCKEPRLIWPDRYHANGTPVSQSLGRIVTVRRDDGLRANGVAA
ncbi:helix-turn-helix domain-containing protein [Acetobacter fallax]|uniref:Transcriptional regulator n=1 Tax=Acetobacter fallax TaxID=1737473 RepID=A0ABX0KA46_9PROT|nr:helix-turn-helix domain-containing protein [Acetobacter fallax]NHO33292.1 transcriptional regulator [Acetobacter fallax]NHO36913.1 transcriptional regulator [Acetobacter fallax]